MKYNEEEFFKDLRRVFVKHGVLQLATTDTPIGFQGNTCEGTFYAKNTLTRLDKPDWYVHQDKYLNTINEKHE
ncbi:hypothetical protein [Sporolactobacillus terrae]|uniref:Uncharacterized protein n=1 Tax=Sporolactobacillus terrae TaxID=269673 RepID=A0A5K7WXY1_9BACL|nr:hypothetical protein [Sporolactobacillus terrae]BBN99152.1 hypothetical protein St703_18570 [Sporolactobacillus terrae]